MLEDLLSTNQQQLTLNQAKGALSTSYEVNKGKRKKFSIIESLEILISECTYETSIKTEIQRHISYSARRVRLPVKLYNMPLFLQQSIFQEIPTRNPTRRLHHRYVSALGMRGIWAQPSVCQQALHNFENIRVNLQAWVPTSRGFLSMLSKIFSFHNRTQYVGNSKSVSGSKPKSEKSSVFSLLMNFSPLYETIREKKIL